jgi:hypothetical protein
MLKLSDEQLDAVMRGAAPIAPARRGAYLREIADKLAVAGELGDGAVFRAIRETQKKHYDVPDLSHDNSKYR